jgi:hypothetical protein
MLSRHPLYFEKYQPLTNRPGARLARLGLGVLRADGDQVMRVSNGDNIEDFQAL